MERRAFLKTLGMGLGAAALPNCVMPPEGVSGNTNFIVIFTDDQGYGDLGCYGSKTIKTPRLDRLAWEGMRFTNFYSQPVCGPARASLLTGCYPARNMRGGWSLNTNEVTVAEVLREAGYTTACVGKWDLSDRKALAGRMPNDQGFQHFYGTLGGNDSGKIKLWKDRKQVGETEDMGMITGLYTDKSISFIKENRNNPFFLYLGHTMPHVKLGASKDFAGTSKAGLYGDTIQELDWHIGRLMDTLEEQGLARNTMVLFASDNGPWLSEGPNGGNAGPLRGGKGGSSEGGFRVPGMLWGPGMVPARVTSDELVSTMDIMPTFTTLAGGTLPKDRVLDGVDQTALFTGQSSKSARKSFYYYVRGELQAVRSGKWKLHIPDRMESFGFDPNPIKVTSHELYNLDNDIGEKKDLASQNTAQVKQLLALADKARSDIGNRGVLGTNAR